MATAGTRRTTTAGDASSSERSGRAGSDAGRDETEAERIDRNLLELMEELRVGIIGVQVLFGFLLALPFTARFAHLSTWQQAVYVTDLLLAAFATAVLIAPVAYHRIVFRRHAKRRLLFRANAFAITGFCVMGVAMCGSVFLVTSVIYSAAVAGIIAAACAVVVFGLWLLVPTSSAAPEEY
jgi:hypothetical protein